METQQSTSTCIRNILVVYVIYMYSLPYMYITLCLLRYDVLSVREKRNEAYR